MVKRILIFIIVYALICVAAAAVFIGAERVCSRIYEPSESDVFRDGEEPLAVASLYGGKFAEVGRYTEGANAGSLFYKIYSQDGNVEFRQDFYVEGVQVDVVEVFPKTEGFGIVCLCTPRDGETPSYGCVFTVNGAWKLESTAFCKAENSGIQISGFENGMDRFVRADAEGNYYAGMYRQHAALFDAAGSIVHVYAPETMAYVSDVSVLGDTVLLAGADSDSGLARYFRNSLCAAYSQSGTLLWQRTLAESETECGCALISETCGESFIVIGRTAQLGEGNTWESVSRIDALTADNDPRRFHVGPDRDSDNASSLYALVLAADGTVTGSAVYSVQSNYYVPALLQFDRTSADSTLVFSSFFAEKLKADSYSISFIRMNPALDTTDSFVVPVRGDTVIYPVQDVDGTGFYIFVSVNGSGEYRLTHFTSVSDLESHMETTSRLRGVVDYYFTLKQKLPVIICLAFVLMFCVSGAARIRRRKAQ